ncbi:MAG TPA: MBL fold metallo-hydrolase [Candidatus Binatia bacterium]|nr:MBL fold metallo-hydrolase [Candidatus Binatia bacterium]
MATRGDGYRPARMIGLMARSLLVPTAPATGSGVPADPAGGVSVTYVGHATVLVRLDGVTLLTDPVYSSRLILPKRLVAPGVPLDALPPLDVVLVSHGHMDHLDVPTHRRLPKTDTVAVVAKNLADLVAGSGYRDVVELAWGDAVTVRDVRITAVPVKHWGTRNVWPDDRGWTGFVVEHASGTVFFPGDTAYFPGFRDYGRRWAIDVALLPIGAYSPPAFRRVHMNPEDALQTLVDLDARAMVPIHWGTFVVSYEPIDEPVRWLGELARVRGLTGRVAVLRHGESRRFPPRTAADRAVPARLGVPASTGA